MMAAWLDAEATKTDANNSPWFRKWRAAVALINGYGKLYIEGLAPADIVESGDNVPFPVLVWVGEEVDKLLGAMLGLKKIVKTSSGG